MKNPPIYLFSISSHPDAISINSLDITFLKPAIDFSKYDYLIITSKQTSKALQQYDKNAYINKPALCISQQSAKSFEALGGKVLALGKGYGDTLVEKVKEYPKETKWLYLRAKIVASDFVAVCNKQGYSIDEAIVYESQCSQDILNVSVEEDAVLIFTSPSSVACFLRNSEIRVSNIVIVIGKTTAKALPKNIEYMISEDKTIDGCFKLLNKV
jgi:uroporphyrinogen-III synthase